jgi:amino acid adenylation domain-containing protein
LTYTTANVSDEQAANISATFTTAVSRIILHSDISAEGLDILSERDQNQIVQWNADTKTETVEACVHDLFVELAKAQPDSQAVCSWDASLTFHELDLVSAKFAQHLQSLGVAPEVKVALCFEKSAYTVVVMLAVLRAGGACVSLSPTYPRQRFKEICTAISARIALASSQYVGLFDDLGLEHIFAVDWSLLNRLPTCSSATRSSHPSDTAFVVFTSGSTGKPKGIVLEHRALCSSIAAHGAVMRFKPSSRVLQFASYTFDVSIGEIFTTLLHGGCICVPSEEERLNDLTRFINRQEINLAYLTSVVASMLDPVEVPGLKSLSLGGEKVLQLLVERWADKVYLVNIYGPAETTIWSTAYADLSPETSAATIGTGVGGLMWIVEPENYNRLCPIGRVGELLIEGPILAREYLGDEEKTRAAFIEDPAWLRGEVVARTAASNATTTRRLYRTGDLARYNPDGTIDYVGRKDNQVKLHGQRVELGEIEEQLMMQLPEARQAAVEMIKSASDNQVLAAFINLGTIDAAETTNKDQQPTAESLIIAMSNELQTRMIKVQATLSGQLPSYMVPNLFVPMRRFPMNNSGKLDRGSLQSIEIPETQLARFSLADVQKRMPSTEIERQLQDLWSGVLGVAESSIGADDSFFRLGGDSITAMQLVAATQKIGMSLTVAAIFRQPQLSAMAQSVESSGAMITESGSDLQPFSLLPASDSLNNVLLSAALQCHVEKGMIEDVYPCTPLQEGLMAISTRQHSAYVLRMVFRLPKNMDLTRLQDAWQRTVDSNAVLRTRVIHSAEFGSLQVVLRNDKINWQRMSGALSTYIEADKQIAVQQGGQLTRYGIVEEESIDRRYFVWTAHHAVYDGWSIGILFNQVKQLLELDYAPSLPPFKNFLAHMSQIDSQSIAVYWRAQMSGARPGNFPQLPSASYDVRTNEKVTYSIPMTRRAGSSVLTSTILRAAWALVLARYSETEDVIFGVTLSGRNAAVPGIAGMLGPTITTVPVRTQIDFSQAVSQYLQTMQQQATDMIPFEHTGLQNIRRALESFDQDALDFKNLFVVQSSVEAEQPGFMGLETLPIELENFDSYPLVTECTVKTAKIDVEIRHDSSCIPTRQIQRMLDHFAHVLDQLTAESDKQALAEVTLLTEQDRNQILKWNEREPEVLDACIHEIFQEQVAAQPTAPAVCSWDGDFTYAELDRHSTVLARRLADLGVGPEVKVPLCFDKSKWMVVAMMAIVKAGGACVCLGASHPVLRLEAIIQQCQTPLIVAGSEHAHLFKHLPQEVLALEPSFFEKDSVMNSENVSTAVTPRNPALILFTSGSTGTPKGIVIEHRSLCSSSKAHGTAWHIGPGTRVFQFAAYTFDVSAADVFTTTMRGGCVCIPSEKERVNDLAGALTRLKANWAFLTPTVAGLLTPDSVPTLKTLVLGGEAATRGNIKSWASKVELIICYGKLFSCPVLTRTGN